MSRTSEGLHIPEREEELVSETDVENALCLEADLLAAEERLFEEMQKSGQTENHGLPGDIVAGQKRLRELREKLEERNGENGR